MFKKSTLLSPSPHSSFCTQPAFYSQSAVHSPLSRVQSSFYTERVLIYQREVGTQNLADVL